MKSKAQSLFEKVNYSIPNVTNSSRAYTRLLFIVKQETSKAFLLQWRVPKEQREMWVPKKAIGQGLMKDDKTGTRYYYSHKYEDKLPNYYSFQIANWLIEATRQDSRSRNYLFFDEWYKYLKKFTNFEDTKKANEVAKQYASAFLKLAKDKLSYLNTKWLEIDQGRLYLKTYTGQYTKIYKRKTVIGPEFTFKLFDHEVRFNKEQLDIRGTKFSSSGETAVIFLRYLITDKIDIKELTELYDSKLERYNPDYGRAEGSYYKEMLNLENWLERIGKILYNEFKLKQPLEKFRYKQNLKTK